MITKSYHEEGSRQIVKESQPVKKAEAVTEEYHWVSSSISENPIAETIDNTVPKDSSFFIILVFFVFTENYEMPGNNN